MFNAYVDFMERYYDISDEAAYDDIVFAYFDLAHECGEYIHNFIMNTAMQEQHNAVEFV